MRGLAAAKHSASKPIPSGRPPSQPAAPRLLDDELVNKERALPIRRKSRLRLLSNLLPLLIIPDPAGYQSSEAVRRKPGPSSCKPVVPSGRRHSSPADVKLRPPYPHQQGTASFEKPPLGSGTPASDPVPEKNQPDALRAKKLSRRKTFMMSSLFNKSSKDSPELPPQQNAPLVSTTQANSALQLPEFKEIQPSPQAERMNLKPRRGSSQPPYLDVAAEIRPCLNDSPSPSPSPERRGRSTSAHPPPPLEGQATNARRIASNSTRCRPGSADSSDGMQGPGHGPDRADRGRLRRSWLPDGRSRSNSHDSSQHQLASAAWVLSPDSTVDYSTTFLVNGEMVEIILG